MKKSHLISILLLLLQGTALLSQDFTLNPETSSIKWEGYAEIGSFSQKGSIMTKNGTLRIIDDKVTDVTVIIDMKSIICQDQNLTSHLLKKDFFHSKKYPTSELILNGDDVKLTLKGSTKSVSPEYSFKREGNEFQVSGTLTIDRTDFGIIYNSARFFKNLGDYAIKDEIDIYFNLSFIED